MQPNCDVLEKYDIYFYVINLPSREDRLKQCLYELSYIGVPDERIVIIQDGIPENNPNLIKYRHRRTAGCAYGHFCAIEKSSLNGHKNIVLVEDDVVFNKDIDILVYFDEMIEELNENCEFFDLVYFKRPPRCGYGHIKHNRYISNVSKYKKVCSHCQYISVRFKQNVISNKYEFLDGRPVDFIYHRIGTALVTKHTLAEQNKELGSDIR